MSEVLCLAEQADAPALVALHATAAVDARPLADLAASGWDRPLVITGDVLGAGRESAAAALINRAYRNPAPLLIVPPLPIGDATRLLGAPAPVEIVRQRAEQVVLTDDALRQAMGRDALHVLCTEAIGTALRAGVLATADGKPVIWAYQPSRAATPVLWVGAQVLLTTARTDPVDREELLVALLAWADLHTKHDHADTTRGAGEIAADPGLLRALVVAWSIRPDLLGDALATWITQKLSVNAGPPERLNAAGAALAALGAVDDTGRPEAGRLAALAGEWGLCAWVREARRLEGNI